MSGLSRTTQGWMILAQVAIALPLANEVSPWVLAVVALCVLWRLGIFFARWNRPQRWLLNLVGIGAAAALISQVSASGTMTTLINLLLLSYALKSIESRTSKDLMIVVLSGYFLIGLHLLNRFGPEMGLHLLLLAAINSACMHSHYRQQAPQHTLWHSAKLVLISVPFAVVLFVLIPRLPPLWQLQNSAIGTTGLSDSMALGDIAELIRSDQLVMRATFADEIPATNQLYWRAIVLDQFDGNRWTQARSNPAGMELQPINGPYREYELMLEANNQRWLPSLRGSVTSHSGTTRLSKQRLGWRSPLVSRTRLALQQGQLANAPQLTQWQRQQNLQLPSTGNQDSRQWGQQLRQQYPEPQQRMMAMMRHFRQQPFRYTLSPPPLGQQQIDDFLFSNQAGFCGHYASAMVFVARAAGVPARIVTGYQGGELTNQPAFVSVYQYNAHAWVEYWQPQQGWQRLDPTAAVAPERIERGAEAALAQQPEFRQAGLFSWRNSPMLAQIRTVFAQLDYHWSRYVIGFDNQRQLKLWGDWLGGFQWWKLTSIVAATLLIIGLWQSGLLRRKPKPNRAVSLYQKAQQQLARFGLERQSHEAPVAHLERIRRQSEPLFQLYQPFCLSFIELQYNPDAQLDQRLQQHYLDFVRQSRRLSSRQVR